MKDVHELEIYACIDGFPDYLVTSKGRVLSLKHGKLEEKRQFTSGQGYKRIEISKNGNNFKFQVHRLVAQAFIPNPDNKPQVNHIDENKINNHVSNLEWMTAKENTNYGTGIDRRSITHSITMSDGRQKGYNHNRSVPVLGINKVNNDIKFYSYIRESIKDGFNPSHISDCCKGKRKSHKGYTWHYIDNKEDTPK